MAAMRAAPECAVQKETIKMETSGKLAWKLRSLEDENLLELLAGHHISQLFLDWKVLREFNADSNFSTRQAKMILDQYGFHVDSFHSIHGCPHDLGETDARLRSQAVSRHKAVIAAASELNSYSVVFHIADTFSRQSCSAACSSIQALLPWAQTHGVVMALENMKVPYYGSRPEEITFFMNEFDHPNLRICFDVGHANISGGIFPVMDEFKNSIAAVHVHDNHGEADEHLPLGLGNIPWGEVFRCLARRGYSRRFSCESRPAKNMGWDYAIRQSVQTFYSVGP